METDAFLVIESGVPFESGMKIPLTAETVRIGRTWQDQKPGIAFDDPHISRGHAEIIYKDGHFELYDLPTSKHGTEVNGELLQKGVPHALKHDDEIVLAKGAAILRFCAQNDPGKTQDIDDLSAEEGTGGSQLPSAESLMVDERRREVLLEGKELRPRVTGYEFELLVLLYRNIGKAVSHEEIVEWVWRDLPNRETIMRQNVATLVHRLRDCLGEYGKYIVNIPAYGYRLDQSKS